ncbi:MAG: leucyl aminopeptidase [Actinomycetes bacterium]
MTALKLASASSNGPVVLGLSAKNGRLTIHHGEVPTKKAFPSSEEKRLLLSILKDLGATGTVDEVVKVPFSKPRLVIFTGLGVTSNQIDHELLRRASGAATRSLLAIQSANYLLPHTSVEELAAIAEGAALGGYVFSEFRKDSKKDALPALATAIIISPLSASGAAKSAIRRAGIIGRRTTLVRDLINTPPSHLTPKTFSERMKKEASALGLKVEILNETSLRQKGYGGISAVGQGSANPPRLLRVSYSPAKAQQRIAYVGKGITFDTGGLALKPADGMEAMKSDMSGAAAVIASVMAIAELKLPIAVDGWAALAENMVSSTATRPSDIISMYGGKTVEVINPDAEGRLVLGDALVRAQEFAALDKSGATLLGVVDVATLTGHQGVALGTRMSAAMTNNPEFQTLFLQACAESGENFWPMPFPEELRPTFDSPVADIANMGDRMGGMLVAGMFLREFIKPENPWLHLDIASPAYNSGTAFGYTPVGGTGVSLRALIRLAELAVSQG